VSKIHVSRRRFLAGTGSMLAMPTILSSGCVSAKGVSARRPLPSERLNIGVIGYGTMGSDNLGNFLNTPQAQVVAICDPVASTGGYGYNAERTLGREPGIQRVNKHYDNADCKGFTDFRDLVALPGLDAVLIATPDHWHAVQSIYAARKGKHIYCQKPLTYTIGQGKAMVREVARAGVTFQVGSQQRSDNYFRMACEFVRNGYIGKLQKIEVGLPGGHAEWGKKGEDLSETPRNPPEYFGAGGFDLWLGPARKRPYTPKIHRPMLWRWNLDYSGGMITDWGAHHLDIMQWALGMDKSGPVAVENLKSNLPDPKAVWNTAGNYSFEVVYADGTRAFVSDSFPNGVTFYGEGGRKIFVTRGKLVTTPDELIRTKLTEKDTKLYVSGVHERNFVECCFSGQETITPCEVGHRSITIAHLANAGLRLGLDRVEWDPLAEVFKGPKAKEANRLMQISPGPALYNGWKL
jgi:predicted dehydrogenase